MQSVNRSLCRGTPSLPWWVALSTFPMQALFQTIEFVSIGKPLQVREVGVAHEKYLRRNIYIESIRSLQIDGSVTKREGDTYHDGFSQLLDAFPLVSEITVGAGDYQLVTPPRLLTDNPSPKPTAELHVKLRLSSDPSDSLELKRFCPKLRAFNCLVRYIVNIGPSRQIDWDLSVWGRMISRAPLHSRLGRLSMLSLRQEQRASPSVSSAIERSFF